MKEPCCKDKIYIKVFFNGNHLEISKIFGWDESKFYFYKNYNNVWADVYEGDLKTVADFNIKLATSGIQFKNESSTLK